MTAAELSNLRALAEAATPGPWTCSALTAVGEDSDIYSPSTSSRIGCEVIAKDAQFIAAANPTAILALIAEIREPTKHKAYWYGMFLDREKERDEARELAFKWRGLWLEAKCWTVNDVMRFSWEESAKEAG